MLQAQRLPDRERQAARLVGGVEHVVPPQGFCREVGVNRRLQRHDHVGQLAGDAHVLDVRDNLPDRVVEALDEMADPHEARLHGVGLHLMRRGIQRNEHLSVVEAIHHQMQLHEAGEQLHDPLDDHPILLKAELHDALESGDQELAGSVHQLQKILHGPVEVCELLADLRRAGSEGVVSGDARDISRLGKLLLQRSPNLGPPVIGKAVRFTASLPDGIVEK
mmetsp:Transcript_12392/g.45832  ORF Transcript_12392/g.45832 Transcript_12392/m.45832 type:complete len:221 (+) Transcript_12392:298-960(+)